MANEMRVQIRLDQTSYDNFQKMAADLNVPFLHFCSMSMAIGAKTLHRQLTAWENLPDSVYQAIATGFADSMAKNMDTGKMFAEFKRMSEEDPEGLKRMAQIIDG